MRDPIQYSKGTMTYRAMKKISSSTINRVDLSGIQYLGFNGTTQSCISALTYIFNCGIPVLRACLVTCESTHAFLIFTKVDGPIAIKAGFTSGYLGEGPRGLATALVLLGKHNVEIEEYVVDLSFFERLEYSCLLQSDIDSIENGKPVRPQQWYDYIYNQGLDLYGSDSFPSSHYPVAIPFAIIDKRIIDLAVAFCGQEDASLVKAFRRLEDIVRKRSGVKGEGSRLFSDAFLPPDAPLKWDVPDIGESKGRANLFSATYMAFRNARVHREVDSCADNLLREFLLVNELYRLEAESMTETQLTEKRTEQAALDELLQSVAKL